jgi:hypothetical protein
MYIYKLNYKDKETAIKDFINKNVYIEFEDLNKLKYLNYGDGIKAVVEIGKVVKTPGVYDAEFKEITAPEYYDGYAFDVMSEIEIKFDNEIFPKKIIHNFAGFEL